LFGLLALSDIAMNLRTVSLHEMVGYLILLYPNWAKTLMVMFRRCYSRYEVQSPLLATFFAIFLFFSSWIGSLSGRCTLLNFFGVSFKLNKILYRGEGVIFTFEIDD